MDFPKDWPQEGPIDLLIHDLPHSSADTEWWYFNSHFKASNGQSFSLFACFFRKKMTGNLDKYSYSGVWALSDLTDKNYHSISYVDPETPKLCLEKLKMLTEADPNLKIALEETFQKQKIPSSDILLNDPVKISFHPFELNLSEMCLKKLTNGNYYLYLANKKKNLHCELTFIPKKIAVRQGENGIVCGTHAEQMFYYSISRCEVDGVLFYQNTKSKINKGTGWYDHEFGINQNPASTLTPTAAWTWISIQLENDFEILLYNTITKNEKNLFCIVINPDGKREFYRDVNFKIKQTWKSLETFSEFDVAWHLHVPEALIDIEIKADFNEQEHVTILTYPSFWEGHCEVEGQFQKKPVKGHAYTEQITHTSAKTIESFFSSVSNVVADEIEKLLPLEPDFKHMLDLVSSKNKAHLLQGIDSKQLIESIILPIRSICDRPGKRWRSYGLIACCILVGGHFKNFKSWLAVPELIHTGSLIIDDVQDKSTLRRGGPACHMIYGEPKAINAGSFAYSLFQLILDKSNLSIEDRCKIYEIYFDTYRAAHVGQAIDLDGHIDILAETIHNRDYQHLQERILAAHRLKSAIPAASLAQMGGILGKGNEAKISTLNYFFETLGVSFQIMDDVLNLRGFVNNHKNRAEDISEGKVTYPIAKSLELLSKEESLWMWDILKAKTKEVSLQQKLVQRLESCGALNMCCNEARDLLEQAWNKLDPCFEESHTKVMLRAFSYYVLNRHY